jgi:hypothetical protein
MTVVGLMPKTRVVSRTPLPIEAHLDHVSLSGWETPFVGRIRQEGGMRTVRMLAPIALFPRGGLATFHDLIVLTVGTKHWYAYHDTPLQQRV